MTFAHTVNIIIALIEQGMIEARQPSVASVTTAGTVEAKGAAAEGSRGFPERGASWAAGEYPADCRSGAGIHKMQVLNCGELSVAAIASVWS